MSANRIQFWLNDRRIETSVAGTTTLLRHLRDDLGMCGTKEGCAEGDCGACTVALLEEREGSEPTFRAVNSCLLFLPMLQGKRVYTVEGIRDPEGTGPDAGYHPAQVAMVETRGSQCGYCTPGIVMSLFEATYRTDMDADWKIDDQLAGNLCRCTGYRPIRDAGKAVSGTRPEDLFRTAMEQYRAGDAGLDLTARAGLAGDQRYLQPTDWDGYFQARADHPDAVMLAGGTDLGLSVTKHHRHFPVVIGLEGLSDLNTIQRTDTHLQVGAGTNLTRLYEFLGDDLPALRKMLRWFGSRQVRSRATLGGNLGTASPIGDMAPVLVALDATIHLRGSTGDRSMPLTDFFLGYRSTALEGDELILSLDIPLSGEGFTSSYKVSKRREMDISAVAAGMHVRLDDAGKVAAIRLAYGGMAPVSAARATQTEAHLLGRPWTEATIEEAAQLISRDFQPIGDQRASDRYRTLVAANLLRGFWIESTTADQAVVQDFPVGTVPIRSAAAGGAR